MSYDTTPFKKSVPRMTGSYFELFYWAPQPNVLKNKTQMIDWSLN